MYTLRKCGQHRYSLTFSKLKLMNKMMETKTDVNFTTSLYNTSIQFTFPYNDSCVSVFPNLIQWKLMLHVYLIIPKIFPSLLFTDHKLVSQQLLSQLKERNPDGPLDNQTWQTEWKPVPLTKVQLCEYENQTL